MTHTHNYRLFLVSHLCKFRIQLPFFATVVILHLRVVICALILNFKFTIYEVSSLQKLILRIYYDYPSRHAEDADFS